MARFLTQTVAVRATGLIYIVSSEGMITPMDIAQYCQLSAVDLRRAHGTFFDPLAAKAFAAGLQAIAAATPSRLCRARCPDEPGWECERNAGHAGRHELDRGRDWWTNSDDEITSPALCKSCGDPCRVGEPCPCALIS